MCVLRGDLFGLQVVRRTRKTNLYLLVFHLAFLLETELLKSTIHFPFWPSIPQCCPCSPRGINTKEDVLCPAGQRRQPIKVVVSRCPAQRMWTVSFCSAFILGIRSYS